MKVQFNLTTSYEDLNRFESRADLLDLMHGFDGVELMQFEDDIRGIIPKERVIGLHMGYFPYWIDFWNGDLESVRKEFDTLEAAYQYYGGNDRSAIINRYRKDLEYAHRWGAEYVVFHVSEAAIAETFLLDYRHTDEEMIDATIELLNELFADEDGSVALLMENLWQPGLTFLRPEMTRRLMDGVKYPNKGIMLDTGHLLHTNLKLRTQEEGLAYIHMLTPTKVGAKAKTLKVQNLNIFVIEQKLKGGSSSFTPIPRLRFIQIRVKKNCGLRFSTKLHYKGFQALTGISSPLNSICTLLS